jgi:rod shape-determining protein MreD
MRVFLVMAVVLLLALFLQTTVVSNITLLSGNADLLLVILAAWSLQERARFTWVWGILAGSLVGIVSGTPWYIYFIAYLSVVGLARLLTRRIWQAPLLAMFAITFIGNLILLFGTFVFRTLFESPLDLGNIFLQVMMPSLLLNLLLAIAIHPMMHALGEWLYPAEAME